MIVLLLALATTHSPTEGERMVTHARTFLGTPYVFGGRGGAGIDCMGTVFAAAEGVQRCGWKSFSVFPSVLGTDRSLGASVEGLAPVASEALDVGKLAVGDVLMLVEKTENPREPSIGELNGHPVWVGLAHGHLLGRGPVDCRGSLRR